MDIDLKILSEKLRQKTAVKLFINSSSPSVKAVKLLKIMQTSFQPDTLYVGKMSDLPGEIKQEEGSINLLCIADSPTPPETVFKNKPVNLIQVAGRIDTIDLFNEGYRT